MARKRFPACIEMPFRRCSIQRVRWMICQGSIVAEEIEEPYISELHD